MNARSLKLRLLLLGAVTISAALLAAGLGIVGLFERHVERRAEAELDTYSRQISAGISFDAKGEPTFNHPLADPRFETPLSGLYWQVRDNVGSRVLRSRSLWDTVLKLPRDVLDMGAVHRHTLEGPSGSSLLVRERPHIQRRPGRGSSGSLSPSTKGRFTLRARNLPGKCFLHLPCLP